MPQQAKVRSIRRFTLMSTWLLLLLIFLAYAGLTYLEAQKQGQQKVRSELFHSAKTLSALITPIIPQSYLKHELDLPTFIHISEKMIHHFFLNNANNYEAPFQPFHLKTIHYQIWNAKTQHLLLKSPGAPNYPLNNSFVPGYYQYTTAHHKQIWQTLVYPTQPNNTIIMVSMRHNAQSKIDLQLFYQHAKYLIILYIIFSLLLFYIIHVSLKPLKQFKKDIQKRDPKSLQPIDTETLPSEMQPAAKALNRLFEKVKLMVSREKRFTADAAHELRTPLATLKTLTEVIQREKDETVRNEFLSKLNVSTDRLSHLVDQLLMLNRISSYDREIPNSENFNLQQTCQIAIDQLKILSDEHQAQIQLDTPKEPILIHANQPLILSLISNLIKNAILYSGDKAHIIIKVINTQTKIEIHIIDHGVGIESDEDLIRIFDRFYRQPGQKKMGSGLGLSIAMNIVDLHHGNIEAHHTGDAPSTGLTVVVSLPKNT